MSGSVSTGASSSFRSCEAWRCESPRHRHRALPRLFHSTADARCEGAFSKLPPHSSNTGKRQRARTESAGLSIHSPNSQVRCRREPSRCLPLRRLGEGGRDGTSRAWPRSCLENPSRQHKRSTMRSAGGQEASCRRSTRDQQAADGGTAESQQATGPPGAHGLEGRLSGLPLP